MGLKTDVEDFGKKPWLAPWRSALEKAAVFWSLAGWCDKDGQAAQRELRELLEAHAAAAVATERARIVALFNAAFEEDNDCEELNALIAGPLGERWSGGMADCEGAHRARTLLQVLDGTVPPEAIGHAFEP